MSRMLPAPKRVTITMEMPDGTVQTFTSVGPVRECSIATDFQYATRQPPSQTSRVISASLNLGMTVTPSEPDPGNICFRVDIDRPGK